MDLASSIGDFIDVSLMTRVLSHILKPQSIKMEIWLKFVRKRVEVAYTHLLGESILVRPGGYVRLYGQKKYFRVIQNFTRRWALMISNDTQSPSEDSISQSY